jgi:membrane protein DedA with SNARE-associated domain
MSRQGLLVAAVLSLVAVAAAVLVDLPDITTALIAATAALDRWTYVVVAAFVFLETVAVLGLLAPGEVTLAVGGAAAAHGDVDLLPLLAIVWIAGVLGDATGFGLGRRHGPALLARTARRMGVDDTRLARITALLERRGGLVLIGGRFVGLLRSFAPFLAGTTSMPLRRLLALSCIGVGTWCGVFVVAGYAASDALHSHLDVAGNLAVAAAGAALLAWSLRRRHLPTRPRMELPC